MKHITLLLLGVFMLLLSVSGPGGPGTQTRAEAVYSYTDPSGAQVYLQPVGDMYVVEVNAQLSDANREALRDELARAGLEFLSERPEDFPKAGEAQTLAQAIWVCRSDGLEPAAATRRVIEVNATMRTKAVTDAVLGVLPVFRGQEGHKYTYFRPAYIGVALKHDIPRGDVADRLRRMPWSKEAVDSTTREGAYAKYVFRRVALRVDISVGVFAALDSLRETAWLRGSSLIALDWWANLGTEDTRRMQWQLATGKRGKLQGGMLVFIANTLEVDGPEAALELARTEMNADSAGNLRLAIYGEGDINEAKSDLTALGIAIVDAMQYELESEPKVSIVVDLPPSLLIDLIDLPWVTRVEFLLGDGIIMH
jgi:hypothetical protein